MHRFFDKRTTVVDVSDKEATSSKTVFTTIALSKTSAVAVQAPSPISGHDHILG
jgi:hypothetical protein